MEINNEIRKENFCWPRIGSVVDRTPAAGIITARLNYDADSWAAMMVHVAVILLRGNAARMVNVAGKYVVTELVVS